MAHVRCPECGKVCDAEDGFCPKCGREFKKSDIQTSPIPGMPQAAPITVPDGMSADEMMEKGFQLISEDSYTEAAVYWTEAAKKGYVPDDDVYGRMVSETGASMLRISALANVTLRKGAADLSLVLEDRDFSSDLLAEYARRVPETDNQVTLVNLSTNYVVLMIESFNVYTDLRDLQQMCLNAQLFLKAVAARDEELSSDGTLDVEKAQKYIGTNVDLVDELASQITAAVESLSMEQMDRLGDHWSSQSALPYTSDLIVALQFSIQLRVTGKLSSKMFRKTRDGAIRGFVTKYMAPSM